MLFKIKNFTFFLLINLIGITAINAMHIVPTTYADESDEFIPLLASTHFNPTAAYVKILMDNSIENKEAGLNMMKFYRADKDLATELHELIKNEYDNDINIALINLTDTDEQDLEGNDIGNEKIELFKVVIDLAPDLNVIGKEELCPVLISALENFNYSALKLLIETKRVDLDIKDSHRFTALKLAVCRDLIEYAKLLLDSGANPDIQCGKDNNYFGQERKYALSEGHTCLMLAAFFNRKETIELLLNAGASINIKDVDGLTAIDIAEREDHPELADYLKRTLSNRNFFILFIKTIGKTKQKQKRQQSRLQTRIL